ncbi:hypothetical protein, partial [Mesorhizobium sp.]|uniref:hypothetical protein n=1 Tax=Mesorhizobium sp. TaxID=1871066 RepID=UPI0025B8DB37
GLGGPPLPFSFFPLLFADRPFGADKEKGRLRKRRPRSSGESGEGEAPPSCTSIEGHSCAYHERRVNGSVEISIGKQWDTARHVIGSLLGIRNRAASVRLLAYALLAGQLSKAATVI